MLSNVTQPALRLAFGVHHAPKDAPAKLLRQIDSEAQAIAVSMRAGGHKLASIAAAIGKTESYVSLLRAGKRPVPDRLVASICAATGSNLLRQFRDLQDALAETCERREVDRLATMLREVA